MILTLMKKAVVFGFLGSALMVGLFGTPAGSYVRTAAFKVRSAAKDSVPVQFEIERAKREIDSLTPAIRQHIEQMARAEQDARTLEDEIAETTANLEKQKSTMVALRQELGEDKVTKVGGHDSKRMLQESLRTRLDTYSRCERILSEKKATLASRQKVVESAREHLTAIATQKKALESKLEEIQARLAAIEASNARSKYHFDGSALARAKQSVSELDRRLNVISRVSEVEGRMAEDGTLGPEQVPVGDVTKEFDAKFGGEKTESKIATSVNL
jgi:chromosome segregation ATPase